MDTARTEHELCQSGLVKALEHAIRAGEALLQAKDNVPSGEWQEWLAVNLPEFGESTYQTYMRLARYQDELPADTRSITDASQFLRGLPPATGYQEYPEEIKVEARRLREEEGLSYEKIAAILNVGHTRVSIWCDKHQAHLHMRRNRRDTLRRKKERAALRQKEIQAERVRAANKAGGAIHDAYSSVRLLGEALDNALWDDDDRRNQEQLRNARDLVFKVENHVAYVLGVS